MFLLVPSENFGMNTEVGNKKYNKHHKDNSHKYFKGEVAIMGTYLVVQLVIWGLRFNPW